MYHSGVYCDCVKDWVVILNGPVSLLCSFTLTPKHCQQCNRWYCLWSWYTSIICIFLATKNNSHLIFLILWQMLFLSVMCQALWSLLLEWDHNQIYRTVFKSFVYVVLTCKMCLGYICSSFCTLLFSCSLLFLELCYQITRKPLWIFFVRPFTP